MGETATVTVLVTCAGGPGGISMIKSLTVDPRLELVGVDADQYSLGLHRAELRAAYLVPSGDDPAYVDALARIVERERVRVILPGSDEEVVALASNRDRFEALGVRIPVSDYASVCRAIDKSVMLAIAEKVGVPCPRWSLVERVEDIERATLACPFVLKPAVARGARGFHLIEAWSEAESVLSRLRETYRRVLAQEWIPGGDGTIHAFCAQFDGQGRVQASYMSRSLRTRFAFGGPGLVGEPIVDEDLRRQTLTLLDAAGPWRGPIMTEFKRDERDGALKLLEVNARYWGYSYLATAAGINFPLLSVKVALGEPITPQHTYRTDVVSIRSNEDFIVDRRAIHRRWWW